MDGGIELVQTGERHPLYVKVNGTVEKLHGIFNQGLVLGMAYTGRIDRAAVMFGKSGEIIIDDRLFAVTSSNSRLQIVGDYGCRNAFKIVHGIFTALYQVFLAQEPYRLAVGIMTKRQDGDKHLGFLRLACHLINDFKPVTGKINIHLVCGIVFDMADNLDVKLILADCPFERRQLITVRIFSMVLLKQFSDTRPFSCQAGHISGGARPPVQSVWKRVPDAGIPYSRTFHATAHWKGKEAAQYFFRLKETGGHTCGLCYGKYETYQPFP